MEHHADEQKINVATANGLTKLETHVQSRLSGRIHDFRLMVAGEGLVLRGHAQTYYAKQLAQHAVMEATDLPIQTNDIEVF